MANIFEQAAEIRKIWGGFRQARALLTANNFGVFDHLRKPLSAAEISKKLGTDLRATSILLDALTALRLLKKQKGKYQNTDTASKFLVKGSPYYQGDIIRHSDNLWQNWSGLDEVLRTGKPFHVSHDHDAFIRGMHDLAIMRAKKVIGAVGMKGVRKALDLGGGPGTYSMGMAKKGASVVLFDRPETLKISKDIIKKAGAKNISFMAGDFVCDDIGKGYDLIFISQVLHSCSEDEIRRLFRKCIDALNTKGRIVIQEFFIDDSMTHPLQSALFSINMLVNTPAGRCYSPAEIKAWLSGSGFGKTRDRIMDETVLVSGEKIS